MKLRTAMLVLLFAVSTATAVFIAPFTSWDDQEISGHHYAGSKSPRFQSNETYENDISLYGIQGIIPSATKCIVTVNGKHYAQEFFGGKGSRMPPRRKYGPIPIDTERLRQVPELLAWRSIPPTAPRPELREGTNMVSVHYILDKELVESGQIQIIFNAAVVRAEDYHLAQTQLRDALAPDVPFESLTVYVLILPGRSPEVFKRFDSKPMEEAIGNLPHGSVLHYDGNALMARPPEAQMQEIMAYCKEKGSSFIESPTR